jgi:hypothetical protein
MCAEHELTSRSQPPSWAVGRLLLLRCLLVCSGNCSGYSLERASMGKIDLLR